MWWKVYFYSNVILIILSAFILVTEFSSAFPLLVLQTIAYSIGIYGLYAYLHKKDVFSKRFWLAVLITNLVFEGLYVLYSVSPGISYLSSFSAVGEGNIVIALVGLALSAPLYFANYQLSRGKFYEKKVKAKEAKAENGKPRQWGMFQTALWGYSTVISLITLFLALMPAGNDQRTTDPVSGLLFFGPLLIFWIMIVLQRKQYTWSWWKKALVTTSVFWSAILVFGLLVGSFGSVPVPGEFSIFDLIPMASIFVALIILGREQFERNEA